MGSGLVLGSRGMEIVEREEEGVVRGEGGEGRRGSLEWLVVLILQDLYFLVLGPDLGLQFGYHIVELFVLLVDSVKFLLDQ